MVLIGKFKRYIYFRSNDERTIVWLFIQKYVVPTPKQGSEQMFTIIPKELPKESIQKQNLSHSIPHFDYNISPDTIKFLHLTSPEFLSMKPKEFTTEILKLPHIQFSDYSIPPSMNILILQTILKVKPDIEIYLKLQTQWRLLDMDEYKNNKVLQSFIQSLESSLSLLQNISDPLKKIVFDILMSCMYHFYSFFQNFFKNLLKKGIFLLNSHPQIFN